MFHPFFERELEFYGSLFHINDSTNCAKKRTSQNNLTRGFTLNVHNSEINGNIIVIENDKNIVDLTERFFMEESTRRTPKEQGSKGFKSSISYILLGITEVLAPTSQRAKQEKLFNLIFIIGSQPSSSFLGIDASSLSFSSLTLIRALVMCSVKARLSVLVWGSLDILCRKPITSGKVQLSKSRSLLSTREVVISFRITCLKASMFIEVSSSKVEVVASPLIGPVGLGV